MGGVRRHSLKEDFPPGPPELPAPEPGGLGLGGWALRATSLCASADPAGRAMQAQEAAAAPL
eukprot:COSAG04_NODE_15216_length_539_cov_1.056818_1_plen_61_part_01